MLFRSLAAGNIFQWTNIRKEFKDCLRESDSRSLRYVAEKSDKYLQIVATFAKNFSSQFLVKSSYLKELVSICMMICHFKPIIMSLPRVTLVCDCKSVVLLARSKHTSSRLSDFAQMLASIPHLDIFHVDGNLSLMLITDLMSRALEGLESDRPKIGRAHV